MDLQRANSRADELRQTTLRPPVTDNERLCVRCSLAPVCLPEEERLARAAIPQTETPSDGEMHDESLSMDVLKAETRRADVEWRVDDRIATVAAVPTLFPSKRERQTLHVTSAKARVGRSGESLVVTSEDVLGASTTHRVPIEEIDALVVHGYGQVTTQAIHLCASHDIAVQWLTGGGRFAAGTASSPGRVQQRLRQFTALSEDETRLRLARQLVHAKVETQLRYVLRATRGDRAVRDACRKPIEQIREALRKLAMANSSESLLGLEGISAKAYFAALPRLLGPQVPIELHPAGRSKHPPRDRFNALLSFGYALLHTAVQRSAIAVGLEPALGFYHRPRSAAPPLVLDCMELFRTTLWEMPLIGSVNRLQWDVLGDFSPTPGQVWLSDSGRRKAIALFEQRLEESHRHPHTGQSLTYARMIELELRLLEKEWSGCPGLFAKLRLR